MRKIKEKTWQIEKPVSKKTALKYKKINEIILQVLQNRQIKDFEDFLNPDFDKGLFSPLLLKDMDKASRRILKAKERKEKVVIFGHNDCDGVCSAALLAKAFEFLGIDFEVYIPSRSEGYQIRQDLFHDFSKRKIGLVVTCDFGISDCAAAEEALKYKIDLIITDHHGLPKKLPKAYAIINPLLSPKYPFKELSGCGVAYKLISNIIKEEKFLKWNLDLVAVATIADIVPLTSENRIFVKFGLQVIRKTRNLGLKLLIEKAGLDITKINTYNIGFQIAPRLNSAGRMDHAIASYYLLTTRDKKEAQAIANNLNNLNIKRQKVLDESLKEALEYVRKKSLDRDKLIIVSTKKWPEGILGLISSKITDFFSRPSLVLKQGDGFYKGSARSIDSFHITSALRSLENLLEKVGGHKKAAGLTVKKSFFKSFSEKMVAYANKHISDLDVIPKIIIDKKIKLEEATFELYRALLGLEPFGYGNSKPIFSSYDLKVTSLNQVGRDKKHLKMILSDGKSFISAIGFDFGSFFNKLKVGDLVDVAYNIDQNEWNGEKSLQLNLVDLKKVKAR